MKTRLAGVLARRRDRAQACGDLPAPVWQNVGTYSIVDGTAEVVDMNGLNVAERIYRFVEP